MWKMQIQVPTLNWDELDLNLLDAKCCSVQHSSMCSHQHLHTWSPNWGKGCIQLKHISSMAMVRDYNGIEKIPPSLSIQLLELWVKVSPEWSVGRLLAVELTAGVVPAWWKDYRHLWINRQLGNTNSSGVTWRYIHDLSAWWIWPKFAEVKVLYLQLFCAFLPINFYHY